MNDFDRLVSEMSRREMLAGTLGLGLLLLGGAGCGGFGASGGSSSGGSKGITGTVVPPPGLANTPLQVVSPFADGTQVTNGGFTAKVNGKFPTLVQVIEPSAGRVTLMGLVDPKNPPHVLDANSSAVALLFVSLGGSNLPPENRKELLDLIKSNPNLVALTATIQTALNADPYALENGNAQVIAALATAAAAIRPQAMVLAQPVLAKPAAIQPQLLIEPAGELDGATFVQSSSPLGVQVQNSKRRFASVYTYLVGRVDKDGNQTTIDPPLQVGETLDVPETASLLNLSSGWHPVTSDVIPIKIVGTDSKSIYELVYLCPVFESFDPPFFADPKYAGEVEKWRGTLRDLQAAVFLGFVANFIFEAIGFGGALVWGVSELTGVIAELTTVSTSVEQLILNAQSGFPLIPLTKDLFTVLVGDTVVLRSFTERAAKLLAKAQALQALEIEAGRMAAARYVALRSALAIFIVVGAIGLSADIAAVYIDTLDGNRGDVITATIFQPKVLITPSSQPYHPGDSFTITADAPGATGSKSYHWNLSGSNLANLSDGTQTGRSFDTNNSVVTLATTPSTQSNLVVTVEIFSTVGGSKTSLGTASATYTPQSATGLVYKFFDDDPGRQGLGGSSDAFVEVPLDPSNGAEADIELHLDGVHLYTIFAFVPPAGTPLSTATQDGWDNCTALGVNGQFLYQNPDWDHHNLIIPFVFGDKLVPVVTSQQYGNASVQGTPKSVADANVHAFVTRCKVVVTMNINGSSTPIIYST